MTKKKRRIQHSKDLGHIVGKSKMKPNNSLKQETSSPEECTYSTQIHTTYEHSTKVHDFRFTVSQNSERENSHSLTHYLKLWHKRKKKIDGHTATYK